MGGGAGGSSHEGKTVKVWDYLYLTFSFIWHCLKAGKVQKPGPTNRSINQHVIFKMAWQQVHHCDGSLLFTKETSHDIGAIEYSGNKKMNLVGSVLWLLLAQWLHKHSSAEVKTNYTAKKFDVFLFVCPSCFCTVMFMTTVSPLSHLNSEMVSILFDRGRFVVVHPHSILFLCH